jgi:hypothetical protein
MLLRLAYLGVTNVFAMLRLLSMSDRAFLAALLRRPLRRRALAGKNAKREWVLDADLKSALDAWSHYYLLVFVGVRTGRFRGLGGGVKWSTRHHGIIPGIAS